VVDPFSDKDRVKYSPTSTQENESEDESDDESEDNTPTIK